MYKIDVESESCDKHVQTPGMSPPRAGAWTYCLFTPIDVEALNKCFLDALISCQLSICQNNIHVR